MVFEKGIIKKRTDLNRVFLAVACFELLVLHLLLDWREPVFARISATVRKLNGYTTPTFLKPD